MLCVEVAANLVAKMFSFGIYLLICCSKAWLSTGRSFSKLLFQSPECLVGENTFSDFTLLGSLFESVTTNDLLLNDDATVILLLLGAFCFEPVVRL